MSEQIINLDNLIFRRQYLIFPQDKNINCPFLHETINLGYKYSLSVHKDLKCTRVSHNGISLIILGDIFNYQNPKQNNFDILNEFKFLSFDEILVKTSKYAGRFVIIYASEKDLKIFHDAFASRKIYYVKNDGQLFCSSNPHLLASTLEIEESKEESVQNYYKSNHFKKSQYGHVGDRTQYEEIFQLLPNHYINITPLIIKRYFPKQAIIGKTDKEIVSEAASMIKGFLEAASNRYPIMIPVSAGYDSRVIMAASKNIRHDVLYYLNVREEEKGSPDAVFHKKMLSKLGLKYNLFEIKESYPPDFSAICFRNNPYMNPNFVEVFYHYLINFPNHLNLPGLLIPILKSWRGTQKGTVTPELLASLYKFENYSFAVKFYSDWFLKLENKHTECNIDSYDMLYWEDRNPNFDLQLQQDKDIAQEEFVVFNSSYLMLLMLGYSLKKRKRPYMQLHKDIIFELWPELLKFPFNPSFKKRFYDFFIKIRVYEPLLKIKKGLKSFFSVTYFLKPR